MGNFITKRWYLSILVIPIIVNLFTNTVTAKDIQNYPLSFITIILSVCLTILIVEYYELYQLNKTLQNEENVSIHDAKTIAYLVSTLNMHKNEYILRHSVHVEGLPHSYYNDLKRFTIEAEKASNIIIDKELYNKIETTKEKINLYLSKIVTYMSTIGYEHHNVDKETLEIDPDGELKHRMPDLYYKRVDELNNTATLAYEGIKDLIQLILKKGISLQYDDKSKTSM
ncbi:MAG TPA: hypothetical protein VIN07_03010 [Flavipsychrobacter sp.]